MPRKIVLSLFAMLFVSGLFAQSGTLKGKVVDVDTGEPIPFANVSIMQEGSTVTGGMTDFDGNYTIKPIPAGKYTVQASYVGYKSLQYAGLRINAGKITFQDFKLTVSTQVLQEVEVKDYKVPLISKDQTESGGTVTSEDIAKMPGRSAASVATTVGGVYSQDGEIGSIRGARAEGTVYYVDGVKVRGSSAVPKGAMEQVSVITGGLPAMYGDATGGIISITTKGPSKELFGGVDLVTSHFLDPYDYNLAEFTISGPILYKKTADPNDSTKFKKDPMMGFFISTSFEYQKDRYPSAVGVWTCDEDTLAWLIDNPMRKASSGFVTKLNADYLRKYDENGEEIFHNIKAQRNINSYRINLAGKIDYKPSRNTNLTIGGTFDYINQRLISMNYQMFNWENNGHQVYTSWRTYLRYTQKFTPLTPEDAEKAMIKNAFYQVQVDYSKTHDLNEDESHKDRLFNYGYVGDFETYKIKSYAWTDTLSQYPSGVIMHDGFRDTLVNFTYSDINPVLSKYTDYYYSLYDLNSPYYRNIDLIQLGGGLLNGDFPQSVYGLYNAPGTQYNGYNQSDATQFRVSAAGAADLKDHEISVGFEFEQRSDRYYGVAPVGLWTLARNYMNFHILELDYTNPHPVYDAANVFQDTIWYDRQYSASVQSQFDEKFREYLGLPVDNRDWIDIDNYSPDDFSIDYFSADELLNSGNSYIAYYGYDHHGNRLTSKPSLADFFTKKDDNGRFLRPIAPFEPSYAAAYIQDKFAFYDLIFNVGLRVDRYDANQKVLKDPYSLYETYKVADVVSSGLIPDISIPGNIGDDYVVYVDNVNDPTVIKGFRDGTDPANVKWYDAEGTETDNPNNIAAATGIAPFLVDPDAGLTADAFKDYEPQVTMMPRVSFSFPISDVALFFAHYDVLSKRPGGYNRTDPTDYFFIESNNLNPINNPNLKPEKTIDYELGFQQKLSNTSSLKMSAFYREMRDMIQTQYYGGAYPVNYITYANIDFGTVKGFTAAYDLRRTGNVTLRASYTLQFANGTGSNAQTGLTLIRTGQPNLRTTIPLDFDQRHAIVATVDYRFMNGRLYDGPKWFGKDIFQNTGANFVVRFGTGSPYSRRNLETNYLIGSINGSRKPSITTIDMRIDRDILVEWGSTEGESKKKGMNINIYMDIQNLLNTKNVVGVYDKTGNPDDDGYLVNPGNQSLIENQNDPEAYRNYRTMWMNSPYNYTLPRRIRLGVNIMF
ncbi:MAG: TonB-dependent receptor [Bacteroidota bacterium]